MRDESPIGTAPLHRSDIVVKLRAPVAWGEGAGFRLNIDLASARVETPRTRSFHDLADELARIFDADIRRIDWRLGAKSLAALEAAQESGRLDSRGANIASLLLYARVVFPAAQPPLPIVRWLSSRPEVEAAYIEGGPQRPPAAPSPPDPYESRQAYLRREPDGLGIRCAWERQGGEGQGIGFVDIEKGWLFEHDDLVDWGLRQPLYGRNGDQQGHGTSVLGIVAATRNRKGIVGLAPKLRLIGVASPYSDDGKYCCKPEVFSNVIEHDLAAGDVLLIEIQTAYNNMGPELPVEVEPAIRDVLRCATFTHGITTIEAAGNGGVPLDAWEPHPGAQPPYRPLARPGGVDSGAVLVGAVDSTAPHGTSKDSNYGKRIDCVVWGDHVYTAGFDDRFFASKDDHTQDYWNFSGTSSAAALAAGIAVLVQGMQRAKNGKPFDPVALRQILSDPSIGTVCPTDHGSFAGVMPNLEEIVKKFGYK